MEWNAKDGLLRDEKRKFGGNGTYIFNCESELSREEKIEFVDRFQVGNLSRVLEIVDKFNQEKDNLPKDSYGYVKTVSLKAWIKRNNARGLIDDDYHYGKIYFLGCERYINSRTDFISYKWGYDTHEDYVDEIFHRQLNALVKEENSYFVSHDDLEVKKRQVYEYIKSYNVTFGYSVVFSSQYCICKSVDENREYVQFTLEELDDLLDRFQKLEAFITSLTIEGV